MKRNQPLTKSNINFWNNLKSSLLAGLGVGLLVGLVLGLKVARINPSIVHFSDTWLLATHFMALYAIAGIAAGIVIGLIFYPFLRKKGMKRTRFLFNIYLPTIALLILFHYFRVYVLTHFIANPLLPIKGSLFWNIGFSILALVITVLAIRLAIYLFAKWRLDRIIGFSGMGILIVWLVLGIFPPGKSAIEVGIKPEFQEYTPHPTGAKVAIIALDGAWWEVIDSMMTQGKLPNFQKLTQNGSRADLNTLYPTFSAMIWTSVITGKLPQQHGINSFLVWTFPLTGVRLPLFRLPWLAPELLWAQDHIATVSPIPSNYRTTSALWNIFSENDISVGVINWFTTWPAEKVKGYMYTDHALYNKLDVLTNYKKRQGSSIFDIYPPELLTELQKFSYTPRDISREDLSRFVNVESDAFWNEFKALNTYNYLDLAYEASMFKYSFPGDKTVIDAANYLLDTKVQPDFWAIYIQGMDSMSHQYLKYYFWPEHQDKLIPINLNRYKNLVANYYQYLDQALGEFLRKLDPKTYVFVISDHGFDKEMLPTGHYHHTKPEKMGESEEFHISKTHPGIFLAKGPGIKKNYLVPEVTVLDLAPTILYIIGFPVARDMEGKVLSDIFQNPTASDTIPTYDRWKSGDRTIIETSVDKEVREKLKALGYMK
jgi:hypothetical protein